MSVTAILRQLTYARADLLALTMAPFGRTVLAGCGKPPSRQSLLPSLGSGFRSHFCSYYFLGALASNDSSGAASRGRVICVSAFYVSIRAHCIWRAFVIGISYSTPKQGFKIGEGGSFNEDSSYRVHVRWILVSGSLAVSADFHHAAQLRRHGWQSGLPGASPGYQWEFLRGNGRWRGQQQQGLRR